MDIKEVRKNSKAEILKMIEEKKESLHTFRFGIAGAKTKNVKEGKNLRKDIAKMITVMKEMK